MSYGYSLSDRDESGETPMDIAMKEKKSREEYAKRQAKHHREATKCVAPELDDELEDSEMVGLEEVIVVDDDEYGCDTEHSSSSTTITSSSLHLRFKQYDKSLA